ncbi:MAG: hypothetical protein F6I01_002160 [Aerococcus sanguinicola]
MAKNTSLPTTSYTADSAKNFVVGAGAVVQDFKYDKEKGAYTYKALGATSGGSKISLKTEMRQMEIDGILSTPVGGDMVDSAEGTMELSFLEHNLEKFKMALIGNIITASADDVFEAGTEYVKPTSQILEENYVPGLAHISKLSSGDFLVVRFDYAICTEGLEMEPQDKNDNTLSVTFAARTDPDNLEDASLPVKVAVIKKSTLKGSEVRA